MCEDLRGCKGLGDNGFLHLGNRAGAAVVAELTTVATLLRTIGGWWCRMTDVRVVLGNLTRAPVVPNHAAVAAALHTRKCKGDLRWARRRASKLGHRRCHVDRV